MKLKSYSLYVFLILLLGLVLCLPLLNGSFWLDEAAQALESTRPLSQQLKLTGDFQPPLYHLLVHFLAYISHTEWWLRLASVIPSLFTLWLTILLSKNILGQKASLMTGLLLATSQFFVFFSQELRPYSLAAFWGVLSLYLLQVNPRSKWIVIVNALGLLTVYTYVLAILGQIVLVLRSKTILHSSFFIHLVFSFLLCLPWLPSFFTQFSVGKDLQASLPGWSQVVSPSFLKALPLVFQKFALGRVAIPNHLPGLALHGLITFIVVAVSLFSLNNPKLKSLSLYFWITLLFAWLLHLFIPILDPKRVLFLLPVFIILVTGGLMQFKKYFLLFFILVFLNIFFLVSYWTISDLQREPWRKAIQELEAVVPEKVAVIFAFSAPFSPWNWYQGKNLPTISTGYLVNQKLDNLDPKLISVLNYHDVYVIDYLMDITDPKRLIYQWLDKSGFSENDFLQYPGIGKIRHFQKNNPFAYESVR